MNQCKNGRNSSQKENTQEEPTLTVFFQHSHFSTCKLEPAGISSIYLFGKQLSGIQFTRNWRFWSQMWHSTQVSRLFCQLSFTFSTLQQSFWCCTHLLWQVSALLICIWCFHLHFFPVLNDKTGIFTCVLSPSVWISWHFRLINFKTVFIFLLLPSNMLLLFSLPSEL